ncbi:hypothetical protein [Photobacterium damselae]|uniref:hypothetical protein n=1 Tax=Photobacterium damselae TaxID=38293 RepID=UPI0010FEA6AC|nr:hypothetical protein [Photobacterium damselae]MBA5685090.1 hypothetical protein [Photobacterium damselae subsp. damselae]TLS77198.1 hypothetical protein FD721_12205 [Photobacterium damselae subsp. damselae]TLS84176.1 hypothetical protein FD720_18155 [Photobacterium damselae subsp. damselae]
MEMPSDELLLEKIKTELEKKYGIIHDDEPALFISVANIAAMKVLLQEFSQYNNKEKEKITIEFEHIINKFDDTLSWYDKRLKHQVLLSSTELLTKQTSEYRDVCDRLVQQLEWELSQHKISLQEVRKPDVTNENKTSFIEYLTWFNTALLIILVLLVAFS